MGKYTALMQVLTDEGLATRETLHQPELPERDWLTLAHDATYVDQVIASTVPPMVEREIGFPVDERVSRRARLAASGTLMAARLALTHSIACNTAGGSHHARYSQGAGFCTLNDVAIATHVLMAEGAIARPLIVDLDVHQGDGTAEIFADDPRVFTFSMHCRDNYPARKRSSTWDIDLPSGFAGPNYLDTLATLLPELIGDAKPDIVFYNAGVDVHAGDKLGKLKLSDADILERDRMVTRFFREMDVPVCGVIGGGYADDIEALADRHANLFRAAAEVS
jgi:acetoin utilization deacetylase AcuC-like enzyme